MTTNTPAAPTELKLCINCEFHAERARDRERFCTHPKHTQTSLVDGSKTYKPCREARQDWPFPHGRKGIDHCGSEGQFFVAQAISASAFEQPTSEPL